MIDAHFVFVGVLLNIFGTISYVRGTLAGTTRPNRVTWFMWTLAPMITFAAQLSEGVGLIALTTFIAGFCPLVVFLASFVNRNAYWNITRLDWFCGAMSLLALVLWAITRTGLVAVVFGVLADFLAAIPTLLKAYRQPHTEKATSFAAAGISGLIALLTIDHWTVANYAFSLYLVVFCTSITLVIKVFHQR